MSTGTEPDIHLNILPLLRERAVYVRDNGTGQDDSDFINKSFKGILRLSPNDSSSYLEMENHISYNDSNEDYISFEDVINNQFKKQFIKVSTSDGYLLDLRISHNALEYNNLYILGAAKVNNDSNIGTLQLYAADNKSFGFGKSFIVSNYNKKALRDGEALGFNRFNPIDDSNIDDAFILVTGSNGTMDFANANEIVETFVKSALMQLSSVPTGSIHGIPVNIHQYEKLLKKSKGHNISAEDNDPIIRDYLLCDGSYYKVKDFPELAKILYKEKICYSKNKASFDKNKNKQVVNYAEITEDDAAAGNIFEKTIILDPTVDPKDENGSETVKVFRVPDYRGMFFQTVVPGLSTAHKNIVGSYERDSIKSDQLMIEKSLDQHYHYIVLDSPNNTINLNIGHQAEVTKDVGLGKYCPLNTTKPAALTRYGANVAKNFNFLTYTKAEFRAMGHNKKCCKPCRWKSESQKMGVSPVYTPNVRDRHCIVGGPTAGYMLSTVTPKRAKSISNSDWVGAMSWTIDMAIPRSSYPDTYTLDNNINYTKAPNDPIYAGKPIDYVSYDSEALKDILGYENTPEFYAILPLIKI